MSRKHLIKSLNFALNREVVAASKNILKLAIVVGADDDRVRRTYWHCIDREMRHAESISELIIELWGVPLIAGATLLSPGDRRSGARLSLIEMLRADYLEELRGVAGYLGMARLAGMLSLPRTKSSLTELARDSTLSANRIKRLEGTLYSVRSAAGDIRWFDDNVSTEQIPDSAEETAVA